MNILICVKQVPGSSNVKVDEKTGLLIRPKAGNKLNPYDLFALEEGLVLKENNDDVSISVLTMGPPQAAESLNECIWMGCDNGYLVSDRAFGGAGVLATSYTLSSAIKKIGKADLILCGKQTTDGDTAQVGAELAEHLGIPHISNVISIESICEDSIIVKALQDNLVITEKLALPALICLDGDINTPRLPSYRRKKSIGSGNIETITLNDLEDKDVSHYGQKGSPTQVQKIFPPEKKKDKVIYNASAREEAEKLVSILIDKKFIVEA